MKKWISIFILISLLTGGCSNYKELNNIAIVIGMGLDYLPKEKKYIMIEQILNPNALSTQRQSGAQEIPMISIVEKGRTISEAARLASKRISRTSIYSHVNLIVIGETLSAEKSLDTILDVFERDAKIRTNIPVVIARKESVYNILNNVPPLDRLPAKAIPGKVTNSANHLGENHETIIREIITRISSKGREPSIPGVSLVSETPKARSLENTEKVKATFVVLNGIGIFKDGKLTGWLDGPPARSIQFIDNVIKETNIQMECEKEKYDSLELIRVKTKNDIKVIKGVPNIHVKVKAVGYIDEILCNDDFEKAETLDIYENKSEKVVQEMILNGLTQAKKIGGDVFGFGDQLHISNPRTFQKYKKSWNETFQKSKFIITVDIQIKDVGMRKEHYTHN